MEQTVIDFYDDCGMGWRSILATASHRDKIPMPRVLAAATEVYEIVEKDPDAILPINYYREIKLRARLVDASAFEERERVADSAMYLINKYKRKAFNTNLYWIIGSSLVACAVLSVVIHYG